MANNNLKNNRSEYEKIRDACTFGHDKTMEKVEKLKAQGWTFYDSRGALTSEQAEQARQEAE